MNDNKQQAPKNALMRYLPVAVILAALVAFFGFGLHKYFSIETLREHRESLTAWVDKSPWQAIGLFMLVYAGAVAISFPGASILTIFGGFLFGPIKGTIGVVIAATIGALIIFTVAKTALGDTLRQKASGFVKKMEQGFREDELSYMFLLRIVPIFPFWAINIVAGVLGVSFRNMLIGTLFGIIPGSFVYVLIGNGIGAAFDAGEDVNLGGVLLQPSTLLPIIGLAVLALIPIIYKKVAKKSPQKSTL